MRVANETAWAEPIETPSAKTHKVLERRLVNWASRTRDDFCLSKVSEKGKRRLVTEALRSWAVFPPVEYVGRSFTRAFHLFAFILVYLLVLYRNTAANLVAQQSFSEPRAIAVCPSRGRNVSLEAIGQQPSIESHSPSSAPS